MFKILLHGFIALLLVCKVITIYADSYFTPEIIVITSHQFPLEGIESLNLPNIHIHYLDAIDVIESRLSDSLPTEFEQAKALIKARIAEMDPAVFEQQLHEAYQPLLLMMRYQLDRYPAIIFDSQTVIYGVTDISQAIQRYQQWEKIRRGSHHE